MIVCDLSCTHSHFPLLPPLILSLQVEQEKRTAHQSAMSPSCSWQTPRQTWMTGSRPYGGSSGRRSEGVKPNLSTETWETWPLLRKHTDFHPWTNWPHWNGKKTKKKTNVGHKSTKSKTCKVVKIEFIALDKTGIRWNNILYLNFFLPMIKGQRWVLLSRKSLFPL